MPAPFRVIGGDAERGQAPVMSCGYTACDAMSVRRHRRASAEPAMMLAPWLQGLAVISPATAMPDVGSTEAEAPHAAAWLPALG